MSSRRRRVLIVCAVLWAMYLVGVNALLNTGILLRLVAPHPERTTLSWERAWTVVPGLVHVRGFELRSHTRGIVWRLEVDRARALVNLPALPFRCFDALTVRARGVEWELDRAETVVPRKKKKKPGFRIRIRRAKVDRIRSLALSGLTLEGTMRARGGVDTRARGPLRVFGAQLEVVSGTLRKAHDVLVSDLDLKLRGSVDSHVPREHREEGMLPFLVARAQVTGEVADLGLLDLFLKETQFVSFGGGSGRLEADLRLQRGVVEPESRLVTEEATYTVDYLGYHAVGTGRIVGFSAADPALDEVLRFDLVQFTLGSKGEEDPYLDGRGLTVSLRGDAGLDLVGGKKVLDIVVDLLDAEVPDMTVYNRNLPEKAGIHIVSGEGRLTSHVELSQRAGTGGGWVNLRADGLVVDFKNRQVVGDLAVQAHARVLDLEQKVLDASGTRVEFRNADVFVVEGVAENDEQTGEERPGWWGVVELPESRLELTRPVAIEADFTIEAESAGPVFALFAKTQKKADKLERRLKTEDLRGGGHVELGEGRIAITGVEIDAGKARLRADLCFKNGETHGLIHGKYGILAVAAELHGDNETLHLTSPKKWFEKNRAEFVCGLDVGSQASGLRSHERK